MASWRSAFATSLARSLSARSAMHAFRRWTRREAAPFILFASRRGRARSRAKSLRPPYAARTTRRSRFCNHSVTWSSRSRPHRSTRISAMRSCSSLARRPQPSSTRRTAFATSPCSATSSSPSRGRSSTTPSIAARRRSHERVRCSRRPCRPTRRRRAATTCSSPRRCQSSRGRRAISRPSSRAPSSPRASRASWGYTPLQNIAGAPAISLPLAWSEGGLPIGMQLAARRGADGLLLALAAQLEAARPWAGRVPPIFRT